MNARNSLVVLVLVLAVAGAVTWFLRRGTSKHVAESRPIRSAAELEELVYRTPFDVDLELELARASCQKFDHSMKTDEAAASECLTAYLFASIESGTRKDIFNELQERANALSTLAGVPEGSFDYKPFQEIYSLGIKPNIRHILNIRNDLEAICERIHADDHGLENVIAAQVAVERYLQLAYDVERGREQIRFPEGIYHFTENYYKDWEIKMRSFGVTVGNNPKVPNSSVIVDGSLAAPLDSGAYQIESGTEFGQFRLPNGREVIPGLRYFEDAAATAATVDNSSAGAQIPASGNTAGSSPEDNPVAVCRRFLQMREQGRWSEAYDLFEAGSQQKMVAELRQAIRQRVSDPNVLQGLDALTDRELYISIGRTGEVHPVQILGSQIHGDSAVVRGRAPKGASYVVLQDEINLVRVNGVWKIVAPLTINLHS